MAEPTPALSPEQMREVRAAHHAARKPRRAAVVATVSGWTTAVFAAPTLLWGVLARDWAALALGMGMSIVAVNELRGARRLRRLDAGGARLLGTNQIAFGIMLVAYAAWSMWWLLTRGLSPTLLTGDAQTDAMMKDLARLVTIAVYSGVAAGGVLGPGAMALYYFTRARHVARALAGAPPWAVDVLRAGA